MVTPQSHLKVLLYITVLVWCLPVVVECTLTCSETEECERMLKAGSECVDGVCTNPFHKGGCLANMLPGWSQVRMCNSEDGLEAFEKGYCRFADTGLEYTEMRLFAQNWEGAMFTTWIIQILLSELLHVPSTIETGIAAAHLDFYALDSPFDYGNANNFDVIRKSNEVSDCRKVVQDSNPDQYTPCAHMIPEVWVHQRATTWELTLGGEIEPSSGLGALGHNGFFVPSFTAKENPTLTSYFGFVGEENRRKLAETFLRPTAWEDYCAQVSTTNCTVDDGVASRAPSSDETRRYFVDGAYTGHFRATEDNDCDLYPDSCTGHIADYPCSWVSYAKVQAHHLNVAVKSNGDEPGSNGYTYQQLNEIWSAANATKSNLFSQWWTPEALYQTFLGTDTQLQRVSFPPPTQDCMDHRIDPTSRCSEDLETQVGDPRGACEEPPNPLQKVIATSVYKTTNDPALSDAQRSPAYEFFTTFTITELQQSKIFEYWLELGKDKWNYDPREATCQWVVENIDQLKDFIPRSYPRVVHHGRNELQPLPVAALTLAAIASILVAVVATLTYHRRKQRIMQAAQVEFLAIVLVGHGLVCIGAVLLALPPTDHTCISSEWFINVGYTLELMPLIVKVATLNRLMNAARRMRRVMVRRRDLFQAVLWVTALVMVFMVLWTALDPPQKTRDYVLTSGLTEMSERVVTTVDFCRSESEVWRYICVSFLCVLLVCASVLAFQTRKLRQDFNETQTLAIMIYSHFVFAILRLITYFLEAHLNPDDLGKALSILFSCDAIAAIAFYFVPKLLTTNNRATSLTRLQSNRFLSSSQTHTPTASEVGEPLDASGVTTVAFDGPREQASPGEVSRSTSHDPAKSHPGTDGQALDVDIPPVTGTEAVNSESTDSS